MSRKTTSSKKSRGVTAEKDSFVMNELSGMGPGDMEVENGK